MINQEFKEITCTFECEYTKLQLVLYLVDDKFVIVLFDEVGDQIKTFLDECMDKEIAEKEFELACNDVHMSLTNIQKKITTEENFHEYI